MIARLRLLAATLTLAAAGALVLVTGAPAAAHASLLSTTPDDGAVLRTAPDQVVFTFNEPIRTEPDSVQAFTADGSDWKVDFRGEDNRLVVSPDEDPGKGTVVVAWKVISADGHEVGGSLSFSIGTPTAGAADAGRDPQAPASVTAARWAATGITAVALIAILVLPIVRRPVPRTVWNTAFVAALVAVPLDQLAADGRGLGGLGDWLAWIDGLTRGRSLLLLAGVLLAAVSVSVGRAARVGAIAVAAAAVVLCTAVVVTWPPGRGAPAVATPAERPDSTATHQAALGVAGDVTLTVHQAPGEAVELDLTLTDADGTPLVPFAPPTLSVSSDDIGLGDVPLRRTAPGRYRASVTIPRDGDWTADVSVRTSRFDNPVATVPFTLD